MFYERFCTFVMVIGIVLLAVAIWQCTGDFIALVFPTITGGRRDAAITNLLDMPNEIEVRDEVTGETSTYNTKRDRYMAPDTDMQVATVARRGSAADYGRLIQLVAKFHRGQVTEIPRLLQQKKRDSDLYDELRRRYPRDNPDTTRRDQNQADVIARALRWHVGPVGTYVDIGCNRGGITRALGDLIGAKRVIGIDVIDQKLDNIEYIRADGVIPLPDSSVDLVTANMTLHHIPDLDRTVKEIQRILRPGGTLFIREHDCWNAFDAMLIDIEHILYDRVGGDAGEYRLYHYTNYRGWDRLLAPMQYVHRDYSYSNIRNDITATRAFWCIYKK